MEPANWEWPMGMPGGGNWGHVELTDLCLATYIDSLNEEVNSENGRGAVLAGNRVPKHYGALTSSPYSLQDRLAKQSDAIAKNGPILHPYAFFSDMAPQNAVEIGVIPISRGPTPAPPISSGLP